MLEGTFMHASSTRNADPGLGENKRQPLKRAYLLRTNKLYIQKEGATKKLGTVRWGSPLALPNFID